MKSLLLNGTKDPDSEIDVLYQSLVDELNQRGWDINSLILREFNIAPCQGCFDCWVKTPGVCRIDDFSRELTGEMVHSDLIIHFTPITFGGYSSELKKAVDRFIPVLLPFFQKIDGEIHHKFRYKTRPSIIVIGYLEEPNPEYERTFRSLINRNSFNMGAPIHESLIYTKGFILSNFLNDFKQIVTEVERRL